MKKIINTLSFIRTVSAILRKTENDDNIRLALMDYNTQPNMFPPVGRESVSPTSGNSKKKIIKRWRLKRWPKPYKDLTVKTML
jgi:hypothetical protein